MELYYGIVTNNNDPAKIGRVQVKITGEHDNTDDNESLPWAEVMQSASIGLIGGVGLSSVLKVGTWVYITKIENTETRYLVLGVAVGVQGEDGNNIPYGSKGISDFGQLAINNDNLNNEAKNDNTKTSNGVSFKYVNTVTPGSYLNSTVYRSENGTMVEINDGLNLFKVTHPSGTTVQISESGDVIITSLNSIKINSKSSVEINAKEDFIVNVDGDVIYSVKGNVDQQVDGDCTQAILGSWDLKTNGDIRQFAYSSIEWNVSDAVKLNTKNVDWTVNDAINMKSSYGLIKNVNVITPKGIDLQTHLHTGVRRGDSTTDSPI